MIAKDHKSTNMLFHIEFSLKLVLLFALFVHGIETANILAGNIIHVISSHHAHFTLKIVKENQSDPLKFSIIYTQAFPCFTLPII